jgi:Zn finger protein HypA/HybF involved in hydrogenase expression
MKDTEGGYTDAEPAKSIFTKDDLKPWIEDEDPEFDNLDNSVDYEEPETSEVSPVERKPIPEGMTIEQLVEEMEENEDTVECTWCNDLFDKDQCRYEVDLGWLCSRCEMAIKSRGETLTFREGSYWDFLDEALKPKTWICEFDGREIGTVEASTEEEAYAAMEREYPEYHYGLYDGVAIVYPADEDELDENVKEIHDLGNEYDGGYPAETPEVSDSHLKLCPECGKETFDIETGICVDCGFN